MSNLQTHYSGILNFYSNERNLIEDWVCQFILMLSYLSWYKIYHLSCRIYYWCAILIAHQIVMAKHGGSCVHFSGISTCGRTSRETVSHPQCPPLPTQAVQNIFTHLRYCDK